MYGLGTLVDEAFRIDDMVMIKSLEPFFEDLDKYTRDYGIDSYIEILKRPLYHTHNSEMFEYILSFKPEILEDIVVIEEILKESNNDPGVVAVLRKYDVNIEY